MLQMYMFGDYLGRHLWKVFRKRGRTSRVIKGTKHTGDGEGMVIVGFVPLLWHRKVANYDAQHFCMIICYFSQLLLKF